MLALAFWVGSRPIWSSSDMELIRDLDSNMPRRLIVDSLVGLLRRLDITVIAEGVETDAEYRALRDMGIKYQQGYLFARPALRASPSLTMPAWRAVA